MRYVMKEKWLNYSRKKKGIIIGSVTLAILLICAAIIAYIMLHPGWKNSEEGYQYKEEWGTTYVVGLNQIDGSDYIFGEDTYLQFGWITYEDATYYADTVGVIVKGEYEIEGEVRHFDETDGRLLSGWFLKDDNQYYYNESGVALKGVQDIEERRYYFDEKGIRKIGMIKVDGKDQLFLEDGTVPGLQEFEKETYFINDNYSLYTGAKVMEEKNYYFDKERYCRTTGLIVIDEKTYLFLEGGTEKGLCDYEGKTYFINDDYTFFTGLKKMDDKRYYFDEKEFGMITGWKTIDGAKYYFDKDKHNAVSGWSTIDGKKYYFTSDCKTANGIMTISGKKYYFSDGISKTGFQTVGGEKYYFISGGGTYSGNKTIDGQSYYFLSSGALAEGWTTIGGTKYYYKNNKKVTEKTQIGGHTYYFNSNGTITTGWQTSGSEKYYYNKYGAKATGWQTISNKKYYFNNNGVMATNTSIGLYSIDSKGVATKAKCSTSNLGAFLDDLLSRYGKSPASAATAVRSNMRYKRMDSSGGTSANAVYAINNKRGACYHYASLHYELCRRMGYSAKYIIGTNGRTGNRHGWIAVSQNGTWYYYDSLYDSVARTKEQMENMGYKWTE